MEETPPPASHHDANPLLRASNPQVSTLEQDVLDEYARLLGNVNKLESKLADLSGDPSSLTLDGLRLLERKTATVCTLLKASVYSIVLQQQIFNESEEQARADEEEQQFRERDDSQGDFLGQGEGGGDEGEGGYYGVERDVSFG
ncbi:DASH complex subunit Dad3-domain-containing protein [Aspergillus taichungensis]|uniref:DASH complex subunit DAD3 n=1 Tax=Aspergillus taichungensis TaxID=482145 RepID=A0A2J5HPL7_9EURO|nr:DASH complex subunit Dad3-domain-containing protein [Aspergillus taichungensis]